VVLRTRKVRESSKIVVFFTKNYGKISAIAKGSLKPKSKFGASLELFTRSAIIFYRKENRDLHTLSHSEILNPYENLKGDVVKVAYASVAGEMVERLLAGDEVNQSMFELLNTALEQIDVAERGQLEVILSSYELKTLHLIGYGPELNACVQCGKPVRDKVWFGLLTGGILCPACNARDLNAVPMRPETLDLLRRYEVEAIPDLRRAAHDGGAAAEAADVLNSFVRAQVGEGAVIRSLDFLERIKDAGYQ
jgi:DNA repair protein RecO (recombination protein O)